MVNSNILLSPTALAGSSLGTTCSYFADTKLRLASVITSLNSFTLREHINLQLGVYQYRLIKSTVRG